MDNNYLFCFCNVHRQITSSITPETACNEQEHWQLSLPGLITSNLDWQT